MNIQEPNNKPVYEILDTVTITKQHSDWLNWEVLRIGQLARQYADEGDLLRAELKLLRHEKVHNLGQLGEAQAELTDLKSKADGFKAEVERLTAFTTRTIIPNDHLKAEVERLTKQKAVFIDNEIMVNEMERLKAEVERLTKAGDAMASWVGEDSHFWWGQPEASVEAWNAAKEGETK